MKRILALLCFSAVSLSPALLWAQQQYQNTVYLPYYRLPRESKPSRYRGGEESSAFDFGRYEPEPFLFYRDTHGLQRGVQPFQEYLIAALGSGRITQINYFRLMPGKAGDGSLDFSGFYPQHIEYLKKLRKIYGFRLHICLAGGSSRFLPVLRKPDMAEKMAQNIVGVVREWGLDGVDFDWEYPRSKTDLAAYIALIENIRQGLEAENTETLQDAPGKHDYRFSVAISRLQSPLSKELFEAVDMVNFMAYDFVPRHSTFEDTSEMVEYLKARYAIPAQKIFLGMPFYGKQIKSGRRRAKTYGRLAQEFDLAPQDNEMDSYYFNGQDMILRKFEFAQNKNLGGIMIWEIGQDSEDHRSLLKMLPRQR